MSEAKIPNLLDSSLEVTQEQVTGLMEYMEKNMNSIYSHDLAHLFSYILFHYQINSTEAMEILMNSIKIHIHYSETEQENEEICDDCAEQEEKTVH